MRIETNQKIFFKFCSVIFLFEIDWFAWRGLLGWVLLFCSFHSRSFILWSTRRHWLYHHSISDRRSSSYCCFVPVSHKRLTKGMKIRQKSIHFFFRPRNQQSYHLSNILALYDNAIHWINWNDRRDSWMANEP